MSPPWNAPRYTSRGMMRQIARQVVITLKAEDFYSRREKSPTMTGLMLIEQSREVRREVELFGNLEERVRNLIDLS